MPDSITRTIAEIEAFDYHHARAWVNLETHVVLFVSLVLSETNATPPGKCVSFPELYQAHQAVFAELVSRSIFDFWESDKAKQSIDRCITL